MNRLEGNGGARFIRLMQQFGKSDGINITVATVTKAPPALAIRLDGDPFDLEGDELVVAESAKSLQAGNKVIVIIAQDGQLYYVIDKVV